MVGRLSKEEIGVVNRRWELLTPVVGTLKKPEYGPHMGDAYGLTYRTGEKEFTLNFFPYKDAEEEKLSSVTAGISKPKGSGSWEPVETFVIDITDPVKAAEEIMKH